MKLWNKGRYQAAPISQPISLHYHLILYISTKAWKNKSCIQVASHLYTLRIIILKQDNTVTLIIHCPSALTWNFIPNWLSPFSRIFTIEKSTHFITFKNNDHIHMTDITLNEELHFRSRTIQHPKPLPSSPLHIFLPFFSLYMHHRIIHASISL